MPIYVYWGEDDFGLEKAIAVLRERVLDSQWTSFNYTTLPPDSPDAVIQGLNEVMTPPFGSGGRLVWLVDTPILGQCPENVLAELQRTLAVIPENSFLLLTSRNKPDERLKSTKLLKQFARFQEFGLISFWDTKVLTESVKEAAETVGVKLTDKSVEMLAAAVGNNTRLLYNELEKLRLYNQGNHKPVDVDAVAELVRNTTQNSLQLAQAMRTGDTAKALVLVRDLTNASEPGLRIVATLVGQFRTWLWVKMMMESGERNPQEIAKAAEVRNYYRIKHIQQEVRNISVEQLISTLPLLLELEVSLKQGASEIPALQTKIIEICQICQVSRQ